MTEQKKQKCNCDSPYRDYGTKICLNCGGVLDFESGKVYYFKGEELEEA